VVIKREREKKERKGKRFAMQKMQKPTRTKIKRSERVFVDPKLGERWQSAAVLLLLLWCY